MKADDFLPPKSDLINIAIEDVLAHAVTESDRHDMLRAWLMLGTEYLARQAGRRQACMVLHELEEFVNHAQPGKPWPE